jgi:DNA-binding MarR family transcriptional regulator
MTTPSQLRHVLVSANTHRLSDSSLALLCLLHEHGDITMTAAARHLRHSTAGLTGLADRLIHLGYAVRQHAKSDRRKVILSITPRGCLTCEHILSGIPAAQPAPVSTLGLHLTR